MSDYYPVPMGECEACGKPFEYQPNTNWASIKHLFKRNPSHGYWLAKEHPECLVSLERSAQQDKETRFRQEKNAQIKRAMSELGFPQMLAGKPFEDFRIEPGNKRAHTAVQNWTYSKTGILLYGPPGRGKSHLTAAFAKKWTDMGMTVAFQTMSALLALLRRGYDEDLFDERLRFVSSQAQILVLDDLGAEKSTEWGLEKLYMIVDTRLVAGLPLIVTTNCSEKELEDKVTSRITSRLKEMCSWVEVGGRDWRAQINQSREANAMANSKT